MLIVVLFRILPSRAGRRLGLRLGLGFGFVVAEQIRGLLERLLQFLGGLLKGGLALLKVLLRVLDAALVPGDLGLELFKLEFDAILSHLFLGFPIFLPGLLDDGGDFAFLPVGAAVLGIRPGPPP
ncbi:MAG: hypothetical protein AAB578_09660, partial [Elusimicrobiota bacterium]